MTDFTTCPACEATYRGQVTTCPNCGTTIASAAELAPGQIIDGKYEIVALLGRGGMGSVFKVRHIHLQTYRTIKVMRRDRLGDEAYRSRFAREARLATLLNHPNVALVYDFAALPDGNYYMVSEFIEGLTITQWLARWGRFSPALAVEIALQTLDGLEHIHRAGLLHRDLSSDNIMIAPTGFDDELIAKIIDLGIAKQVAGQILRGDSTQVGLFIGNPRYSSPEQVGMLPEGTELDGRADIYCFGVVLYEMLAGALPFVSKRLEGYAAQHLTMPPPPLRSRPGAEGVPAGIENAVAKALEKDRAQRFQSAKEFAAALAPFRDDLLSRTTRQKVTALLARTESEHEKTERDGLPATIAPSAADLAEHAAFERAIHAGTSEALQEFLRMHPTGTDAPAAHARLDEMQQGLAAVQRMVQQGDISSLRRLATTHTQSAVISTAARAALDEIAANAADGRAGDSLRGPAHVLQERAQQAAAETDAFERATARDTIEAWAEFIELYPASHLVATARRKIAALHEAAWHMGGAMPAAGAEPVAAPSAKEPTREPTPLGWPVRAGIEAGLLLATAAIVFFIVSPAHRDAAVMLPPPVVFAPAIQQLLVDGVPWATVTSIRGNGREWLTGRNLHTPLQIDLPPGDYVVVAVGPDGTSRKTYVAKLTRDAPALVRAEFRQVDIEDYFRSQ